MVTEMTHLHDAVNDRIVPMLKEVSTVLTVPLYGRGVLTFYSDKPVPPFWWLYPGESAEERIAAAQTQETHIVYMRFVMGYRGDRYDGKLVDSLWTFLPTFRQYFRERPSLIQQYGQGKPDHLTSARIGAFSPFGVFDDGTEHVGFEAPITLTFILKHAPILGNL